MFSAVQLEEEMVELLAKNERKDMRGRDRRAI
jgi:hypothetical protein